MSSVKLETLPATALRLLSEYLASLASEAERRAAETARLNAALTEKRNSRLQLAGMVESYLKSGSSLDAAARAIENQTGWRAETVIANYRHHLRQSAAAEKASRNAVALRLAHKGWSNSEIATHLGVSNATVSRIIGRVYRQR